MEPGWALCGVCKQPAKCWPRPGSRTSKANGWRVIQSPSTLFARRIKVALTAQLATEPTKKKWATRIMLTQEEVDAFAEHWLAAWNAHDLDQIMAHYEDHVELCSPVVVQLLNNPAGRVVGEENLRLYFRKGLASFPE